MTWKQFRYSYLPRKGVLLHKMAFGFCMSPQIGQPAEISGLGASPAPPSAAACGEACGVGDVSTEISFISMGAGSSMEIFAANWQAARLVVKTLFSELESQCWDERVQYDKLGLAYPPQKSVRWDTYTAKGRLHGFMVESLEFLKQHPEFRTRRLSQKQLRFLVGCQHFVQEDTNDLWQPEHLRKNQDTFEGVITDSVNLQLIKDVSRSEWSIEGKGFSLQQAFADRGLPPDRAPQSGAAEETRRKDVIIAFQREFVTRLEEYLLAFAARRQLSTMGTRKVIMGITTQMSQCGLANLDRCSVAARYFVHGEGLEQRTVFNISTVGGAAESLKLSILCMKTNFTSYHTEETLLAPVDQSGRNGSVDAGAHGMPKRCKPCSYLYQYATIRFTPAAEVPPWATEAGERIQCTIIDALDEVQIVPE